MNKENCALKLVDEIWCTVEKTSKYRIMFVFKHLLFLFSPVCMQFKFSYDLCCISENLYFQLYITQYSTDEKFPNTKLSHVRSYISEVLLKAPIWIKLSFLVHKIFMYEVLPLYMYIYGVRGAAVGWGTVLQAGRSRVRFPMVSLEFFIDIILLAALWPWGWLSLMSTRNVSWG